jgi:glycosyltransferase involved in cell wall biosynthesis
MKLLIIIDSLGSGGAERSTEVLCDSLRSYNIDFEILCLDKREVGVQNRMIEKEYTINFIPKGNFFKQGYFIMRWIKKGDFEIVHSILFRSNLRTRFARRNIKFLHLESLVNTTYSRERILDKRVNQNILKIYKIFDKITASLYVDHFHSITETVKKHYIDELGIKEEKITVIHRGRQPIILNYNQKPKVIEKSFKIINVGRHEFQKGQIYLLKAIKELKRREKNIQLRIFGRDGSASKEMVDFIKRNNLEDVISLEGFKNNVQDYLLNSNLFVFPSLYEGLGGALIEAQAAGLPIACNNIPVLNEVVRKDINAKFFNVFNTESIVNAILFYYEDSEICRKHGSESLKNFQEKFQLKKNNLKMLELYKKLATN